MSDVTTIVPPDGAHLPAHATTKSYVHSDAALATAVTERPNRNDFLASRGIAPEPAKKTEAALRKSGQGPPLAFKRRR